jgi:hypothetical protein
MSDNSRLVLLEDVGICRDVARVILEFSVDHPLSWCQGGTFEKYDYDEDPSLHSLPDFTIKWVTNCPCGVNCTQCPGELRFQTQNGNWVFPHIAQHANNSEIALKISRKRQVRLWRMKGQWRRVFGEFYANGREMGPPTRYHREHGESGVLIAQMLIRHWGPDNPLTHRLLGQIPDEQDDQYE